MSDEISSRFVSQSEIDATKVRREEQWKAAYARIGQEPPPGLREEADVYDGRSLAEKLAANKAAKQEEWEAKHKLSAQFRSLAPDEIQFLDAVESKRLDEEKQVKEDEAKDLSAFRAAVQARDSALSGPPIPAAQSKTSSASQIKPGTTSQIGGSSSTSQPNPSRSSGVATGSNSGIGGGKSGTVPQSKPEPSKSGVKSQVKPPPKPNPRAKGLSGVVVQPRKRTKSGDDAKANAGGKEAQKDSGATEKADDQEDESAEGDRKRRRVE